MSYLKTEDIIMTLHVDEVNGKKTKSKEGYDFNKVAAMAHGIQNHAFQNIGNILNGSMQPNHSQIGTSASNW